MSMIARNVVKCFAYLNILIELSKGKKLTGYEILVHLKNFGFEISPGTLYHQLRMLSRDGIIRVRQCNPKRGTVYEMTEKGMEVFKEFKKIWEKPLKYAYTEIVGII